MRYKVEYTEQQQAVRLMDMEMVKDLLARRAYLISGNLRDEELNRLWVQKPENMATASYGENWGYMVGMDSLRKNYAGKQIALELQRLQAYHDADPSIEMKEENLGLGYSAVHTVNTGHVVIAYDGATARGLFYDLYQRTVGRPDGTCQTIVVCGPLACDFIKEDGQWKIWHLFQGADHVFTVGEDYASVPIPRPDETNPAYLEFGTPDIPMKTYDPDYGWADNYPPMPDPYETFDVKESYGPEGHPDYVKEVSYK